MRRPSPAAAAALAGALAAAALLGVRAWAIDYDYSIDFQAYWLAGARVAHGEAAKLYDAGGGAGQGTPVALDAHEFKNLPVVAWAFVPFAATDYATAKRAMWWTGLAAILASSLLLGLAVLDDLPWSPATRVAGCAATPSSSHSASASSPKKHANAWKTLVPPPDTAPRECSPRAASLPGLRGAYAALRPSLPDDPRGWGRATS